MRALFRFTELIRPSCPLTPQSIQASHPNHIMQGLQQTWLSLNNILKIFREPDLQPHETFLDAPQNFDNSCQILMNTLWYLSQANEAAGKTREAIASFLQTSSSSVLKGYLVNPNRILREKIPFIWCLLEHLAPLWPTDPDTEQEVLALFSQAWNECFQSFAKEQNQQHAPELFLLSALIKVKAGIAQPFSDKLLQQLIKHTLPCPPANLELEPFLQHQEFLKTLFASLIASFIKRLEHNSLCKSRAGGSFTSASESDLAEAHAIMAEMKDAIYPLQALLSLFAISSQKGWTAYSPSILALTGPLEAILQLKLRELLENCSRIILYPEQQAGELAASLFGLRAALNLTTNLSGLHGKIIQALPCIKSLFTNNKQHPLPLPVIELSAILLETWGCLCRSLEIYLLAQMLKNACIASRLSKAESIWPLMSRYLRLAKVIVKKNTIVANTFKYDVSRVASSLKLAVQNEEFSTEDFENRSPKIYVGIARYFVSQLVRNHSCTQLQLACFLKDPQPMYTAICPSLIERKVWQLPSDETFFKTIEKVHL